MIDFDSNSFFSRLKKVSNDEFSDMLDSLIVNGEEIIGTYKSIRDGVIFTNKRIIAVNVQGVTGKKKDFTSLPYSKISTFSLETAGVFDLDAELEIYLSGVGKVKFQFTGSTDVKQICKLISQYCLA